MSALKLARILVAALGFAAAAAHAGGPLSICSDGTPITYPSPFHAALNYDGGGTLGTLTKAQADAIVNAALANWTNVSTATITLTRGPDLPVDVTLANVNTYYSNFSDGLNPVIYDTDGTIIDAKLGAGASNSVLGFAGSAFFNVAPCRYVEGKAVINGKFSSDTGLMSTVLTHELGHFIGLDHSEINGVQGLSPANFPLMYPVAYRSMATPGDDEVSAISLLYPDTNVPTSYGTLQGNFRTAGATPILGANVWAKENTTAKVYSVVSDYLAQGNGFFKMLLPPGTYTLHASALAANDPLSPSIQLTGGSGAGPYAEDLTGQSFQPPLYSAPNGGGSAMTPVVLGNGSPNQIVITAGCVATADFRINGTGTVSGNCSVTSPPPPDPTPRLSNISTRMQVLGGSNTMIAGIIIGGSTPKTVAITATGPSLAPFGINDFLANPQITLVRSSDQSVVATNDDWQGDPNAAQLQAAGFAPADAHEAGLYVTLPPGAYTAIVQGAGGGTGVSVAGVFEVDHPEIPLVNISTRGEVLTGGDVMIGGLTVSGSAPQAVVITATGPSLAPFGIPNPLANPVLTLVRSSDQSVIATNDDWTNAPNVSHIQASGFAPADPHESAIMVTLDPGAYTAIVQGAGGGTGVAVVGVFTTSVAP